jgi:hypothetical protein
MFAAHGAANESMDVAMPRGRGLARLESRLKRLAPMVILLSTLPGQWMRAADSWDKKHYSEWTESEALKVLQDSAWSRLSFVWLNSEAVVVRSQSRNTTGEVHSEEHSNCCRTFTRIVDGASEGDNPVDETSPGGPVSARRVLSYRVLLYSSVRVRQALARLSRIRGGIWDAPADSSLEKPMEDLVIAVAGPDMRPFESTTSEILVGSTYLRSRKGGRGTAELKDFVPPGVRQDGLALFVFSREVGGKPAFSAADDQIEFGTGEGAFKIRASFKLNKLIVNGVPDF